MFNRLSDSWNKLIFCLHISADFSSFLKLAWASKLFQFHREKLPAREMYDQYKFRLGDRAVDIKLRRYAGDLDIFFEVFWKKAYEDERMKGFRVRTVLDLGANIGMATAFFYTFYPGADYYCVEPDKQNMNLLQENVLKLVPASQVSFLEAAAGPVLSRGEIVSARYAYNKSVSPGANHGGVMIIPVSAIMEGFGLQSIDLVKMDIEGAESLLLDNADWLDKVNHLFIEFHSNEWLLKGKSILAEKGFSWKESRANNMLLLASRTNA